MRSNRVIELVTRTVVAVMLLLSAWVVTGTTAEAQGRRHGSGFNRPNRVFVQPRGFVGPQHRGYIAPRHRAFIGPRVYVGPRFGFYPRGYPAYFPYGYLSYYPYGYSYFSYGYSSYFPYTGVAYLEEQGYRDGYHEGKDDARDGDSYNPTRHSRYRNAYSVLYRDAFLRGYDVGFREYAG